MNLGEPQVLRESIIKAARELFSHFGFKKTTMSDVARKAQVAKGTTYNYFRSKNELFLTVLRKEGDTLIEKMWEAVNSQETSRLKFRDMLITKIKYYKKLSILYEVNRKRAEELMPFVETERGEIAKQEMNIIKEILADGVKRGVFQEINVPAVAKTMVIGIKGLEFGWTLEMSLEEAVAEIDGLLNILFRGIEKR